MDPLNLGKDSCLHILGFLDAHSLLALGACSREWRELTADEGLWQALCQRDQPSLAAQHSLATAGGACCVRLGAALAAAARWVWRRDPARLPHTGPGTPLLTPLPDRCRRGVWQRQ